MASNVETISTERLLLRGIDESDTAEIVKWRSNPEAYKYFKDPHEITVEEHTNWFRNRYPYNEARYDRMCIEKATGSRIGVFGIVREGDTAEVNYILAPEAQHKGYATEGVRALMDYAAQKWGTRKIIAEIHEDNEPSIIMVRKMGFTLAQHKDRFVIYEFEV